MIRLKYFKVIVPCYVFRSSVCRTGTWSSAAAASDTYYKLGYEYFVSLCFSFDFIIQLLSNLDRSRFCQKIFKVYKIRGLAVVEVMCIQEVGSEWNGENHEQSDLYSFSSGFLMPIFTWLRLWTLNYSVILRLMTVIILSFVFLLHKRDHRSYIISNN